MNDKLLPLLMGFIINYDWKMEKQNRQREFMHNLYRSFKSS